MRYSVRIDKYRSKLTSSFDSPTSNYVTYQILNHLVHKQGHYGNIFNFWHIWKKVWGRVITPLWCLKAPSPATKKWIFEFYTKFGFRNDLQTFWPQWLVKSELSLGLCHTHVSRIMSPKRPNGLQITDLSRHRYRILPNTRAGANTKKSRGALAFRCNYI